MLLYIFHKCIYFLSAFLLMNGKIILAIHVKTMYLKHVPELIARAQDIPLCTVLFRDRGSEPITEL